MRSAIPVVVGRSLLIGDMLASPTRRQSQRRHRSRIVRSTPRARSSSRLSWFVETAEKIVEGVGDEFVGHSLLSGRRSDPSVHSILALEAASAVSNPRRLGSLPTLDPAVPSHKV